MEIYISKYKSIFIFKNIRNFTKLKLKLDIRTTWISFSKYHNIATYIKPLSVRSYKVSQRDSSKLIHCNINIRVLNIFNFNYHISKFIHFFILF